MDEPALHWQAFTHTQPPKPGNKSEQPEVTVNGITATEANRSL